VAQCTPKALHSTNTLRGYYLELLHFQTHGALQLATLAFRQVLRAHVL